MKKTFLILLTTLMITCFGQSHTRKTRSDKGGTHKHSTAYNTNHAIYNSNKGGHDSRSFSRNQILVVSGIAVVIISYVTWYIVAEVKRVRRRQTNNKN